MCDCKKNEKINNREFCKKCLYESVLTQISGGRFARMCKNEHQWFLGDGLCRLCVDDFCPTCFIKFYEYKEEYDPWGECRPRRFKCENGHQWSA